MPETTALAQIGMIKWLAGGAFTILTVMLSAAFNWLRLLGKDLADHKVEVAQSYASKEDLKEWKDDIIREIHTLKELLQKDR